MAKYQCVCVCVFFSYFNRKNESDKKNAVDIAIDSLKFLLFGKRQLWRLGYKWEDTIQVDLEEIRCNDVNSIEHV